MLVRMLSGRGVATSDMSANETLAQLHPALSGFKTMFAGFTGWLHIRVGVFQMFTLGHCSSVERGLDDWHGDEDSGGRAQGTEHRLVNKSYPRSPFCACALRPAPLPPPDACQENLRLAPASRIVHGTFFGHARIKQQTEGGEGSRPLPQATSAWHSGTRQSCSQGKPAEGEHDGLEVQLAYR